MKAGKVAEAILKRSVFKTIKYKNDTVCAGSAVGNDAVVSDDSRVISSATAGLIFNEENLYFDCTRCIYAAMNNVAAEGGNPKGIIVDIILPEKRLEQELRELMRHISAVCNEAKLHIAGGNTEVSRAVNRGIVTFTVFGSRDSEWVNPKEYSKESRTIVMSRQIGISGTVGIAKEKYDELTQRFQESYIRRALEMENNMDVRSEAAVAVNVGVKVMHDLSRGGIYSGLWQLAEKTGKGVEVLMDKIHVKQETIELCEQFGINPYKLMSNGALLMVASDGNNLVTELRLKGIDAEIIGRLTDDNDKVLIKNEDKRYIEPPRRDELEIFLNS